MKSGPSTMQVRIEPALQPLVRLHASVGGRTLPAEVNHVLRKEYRRKPKVRDGGKVL